MAGLNLLASLLGASAKDDTDGDTNGNGGGGGDGPGASGAKRRGEKEPFNINLFPDDPFDEAQAKGDGEVCMYVQYCAILLLLERGGSIYLIEIDCWTEPLDESRWVRAVGREPLGKSRWARAVG